MAQEKRKTWLWVLGWIFIFPLPLTILMVKKKTVPTWLRVGAPVIAWLIYAVIAGAAGSPADAEVTPASSAATSSAVSVASTEESDATSSTESRVPSSSAAPSSRAADSSKPPAPSSMSPASSAASAVSEDASQHQETIVYITPTGKKYHYSRSCAGENAIERVLDDAIKASYGPCKKCVG